MTGSFPWCQLASVLCLLINDTITHQTLVDSQADGSLSPGLRKRKFDVMRILILMP